MKYKPYINLLNYRSKKQDLICLEDDIWERSVKDQLDFREKVSHNMCIASCIPISALDLFYMDLDAA